MSELYRAVTVCLFAAALVVTCGCNKLFDLAKVSDAPTDGRSSDSRSDALPNDVLPGCKSVTTHDEDVDGLTDDCDACPTEPGSGVDTDGDGLYDQCDPNLSMSVDGDRILVASVFKNTTELSTDYVTSGTGATPSQANDAAVIPPGGQIALKTALIPTMIVVRLRSFTGNAISALEVGANGVACTIGTSGCSGQTTSTCVSFNTTVANVALSPQDISRISVYKDANGMHCKLDTSAAQVTVDSPGTFVNSVPFVRLDPNASVELPNMVFYGEK